MLYVAMRWLLFLLSNTVTLLCQLARKGGVKAIISENLLAKHPLLILNRSQLKRSSAQATGQIDSRMA